MLRELSLPERAYGTRGPTQRALCAHFVGQSGAARTPAKCAGAVVVGVLALGRQDGR